MISNYLVLMIQALYGGEKASEFLRSRQTRHVRRVISRLLINLCQRRTAQAVPASTQIHQNEFRLATILAQLRRERFARIHHSRKGGNNQRQRCGHLFSDPGAVMAGFRFPYRLHRHGILAHRNTDSQLGAEFHAYRVHGVEQSRVFAGVPRRGHPVGGKFNLSDMFNPRGRDIGDCFAYRHAC